MLSHSAAASSIRSSIRFVADRVPIAAGRDLEPLAIGHLASFLIQLTVFFVAGKGGGHHMRTRPDILSLLDQVGEGLVHKGL